MDNFTTDIFVREIKTQCKQAMYAAKKMEKILSERLIESEDFWFYVQSFLTSSANVSKFLWGTSQKDPIKEKEQKEERRLIRNLLKVKNSSPLQKRTVRNAFEHFDNEIVKWAKDNERKIFIDSIILGRSGISIDGGEVCYLRTFNPDTLSIHFKGKSYYVRPILTELLRINDECDVALETLSKTSNV